MDNYGRLLCRTRKYATAGERPEPEHYATARNRSVLNMFFKINTLLIKTSKSDLKTNSSKSVLPECQTVWIQIRTNILLILLYQQMTKEKGLNKSFYFNPFYYGVFPHTYWNNKQGFAHFSLRGHRSKFLNLNVFFCPWWFFSCRDV